MQRLLQLDAEQLGEVVKVVVHRVVREGEHVQRNLLEARQPLAVRAPLHKRAADLCVLVEVEAALLGHRLGHVERVAWRAGGAQREERGAGRLLRRASAAQQVLVARERVGQVGRLDVGAQVRLERRDGEVAGDHEARRRDDLSCTTPTHRAALRVCGATTGSL